jgi:hypothetical protein
MHDWTENYLLEILYLKGTLENIFPAILKGKGKAIPLQT